MNIKIQIMLKTGIKVTLWKTKFHLSAKKTNVSVAYLIRNKLLSY